MHLRSCSAILLLRARASRVCNRRRFTRCPLPRETAPASDLPFLVLLGVALSAGGLASWRWKALEGSGKGPSPRKETSYGRRPRLRRLSACRVPAKKWTPEQGCAKCTACPVAYAPQESHQTVRPVMKSRWPLAHPRALISPKPCVFLAHLTWAEPSHLCAAIFVHALGFARQTRHDH